MTTNLVMGCIDGSRSTPAVCDYAAWASLRLDAPLVFLHVLDEAGSSKSLDLSGNIGLGSREHLLEELVDLDAKRARIMREQGQLMLEAAVERAHADGVGAPQTRQRHGDLVETLRELEHEMRLLVIGRQGKQGDNQGDHVGSHLESVIRTMHRPILVTAGEFREPRSVMLAFDNGPSTRKGIEMIAGSPLFKGLPIHLLMVGADTNDAWEAINAAKGQLEQAGFTVHASIRAGDVEKALLEYEEEQDIDMIVMGAYGHSRIRQFFVGSTTTNILAHTQRPLLLLR
ncbi:Nucleotide-binding universal stress protein, UspA family [Halopseudomonas salegens]|uniref:Nucleotide-binding universal stress protein, UspA family n=2 Tax=Halopseudomonas salegens TaxID=1434072 RepID=A0A1H2GF72_9GAMM|nr:Nucleotide-binding universal stress protein, UspA family [Halopseudomonas salegens]